MQDVDWVFGGDIRVVWCGLVEPFRRTRPRRRWRRPRPNSSRGLWRFEAPPSFHNPQCEKSIRNLKPLNSHQELKTDHAEEMQRKDAHIARGAEQRARDLENQAREMAESMESADRLLAEKMAEMARDFAAKVQPFVLESRGA